MKSLRRLLLERLVARQPRRALELSCEALGVCGVQVRLPPGSPLFREHGGQVIDLAVDRVMTPFVLRHGEWQTEAVDFAAAHLGREPSVLVDLGANIGLVTRQLLHRLPAIAAAACFEPHPLHFRMLQSNLAHLPRCDLQQVAIAAGPGELRFYEEVDNAGNYSLNLDAMRGKAYRTSVVRCIEASEENLLGRLPAALQRSPILWKSDTQGHDELIATLLSDAFWDRVQVGVMEISRIERPAFDRKRLASILATFPMRRFGDERERNVDVGEIIDFCSGSDEQHRDLFFARA